MGLHKIGKFQFGFSKEGVSYGWGDGEIKRIHFGKGEGDFDQPEDGYGEDSYDSYADDGGYEDSYASEDEYEDADYADQDYEDSEYDYEDSDYEDSGYHEEYDDGQYYEDGDYAEDGEFEEPGTLLRYVEENDWVTYALLVLLPPLGIYLLWRRQKFETMLRAGVSAVSALWFVGIIVLLIVLLPRGTEPDPNSANPGMTFLTPSPTPSVSATLAPSPSPTVAPSGLPGLPGVDSTDSLTPTATPISSLGTQTGEDSSGYVYSQATGVYYHNSDTCPNLIANVAVSRVNVAAAQSRNQVQCPLCYGEATFYMTDTGTWYHSKSDCNGMRNARTVTEAQARNAGKTACPVCVSGTATSLPQTTANANASATLNKITQLSQNISSDRSGVKVWCTSGGTYFHTKSNCSGMSGANQVTLLRAMQMGKAPCSTCAKAARTSVWCTSSGTYYHDNSSCTGMTGATKVPLYFALVLGKSACPTCMSGHASNSTGGTDSTGTGTTTPSSKDVYVWATSSGQYYHVKQHCGGMSGASRVLLRTMLEQGRPACPTCASAAGTTVWAASGGRYYHSYATCSGMSGAKSGTVAQALALGFSKCPECWLSSDETGQTAPGATVGPTSAPGASASGVSVYCTTNGVHYHTQRNCTGMSGASRVSLESAIQAGKTACPTCASAANRTVYGVRGGRYYHYTTNCNVESLSNAIRGTMAQALVNGYQPCPTCVRGSQGETTGQSSNRFTSGTSGVRVYASTSGANYHTSKSCAGAGASYVTLETALNYGKTACPKCAKVGSTKVYATSGSKYFHLTEAHAGSGASSGTLGTALAYGFTMCPECYEVATGNPNAPGSNPDTPTSSNIFKAGTSGYKVYAKADAANFHTSRDCPDCPSGTSYVTLETALNYGKKACSKCASVAYTRVYGTANGTYYHLTKSCRYCPSGASRSYVGYAVALGLKACPICVRGNIGDTGDDDGDGTIVSPNLTVYIDLQGDSSAYVYHKSSKCSRSGMLSGDGVTLEFAMEQGFTACPYCF